MACHGAELVYHGPELVYHGAELVYHGAELVYHVDDLVYQGEIPQKGRGELASGQGRAAAKRPPAPASAHPLAQSFLFVEFLHGIPAQPHDIPAQLHGGRGWGAPLSEVVFFSDTNHDAS